MRNFSTVLIYSGRGLFPIISSPNSGIFVQRRLKILKQFGITYTAVNQLYDEKPLLRFAKRLLGRNTNSNENPNSYIEYPFSLYTYISDQINILDRMLCSKYENWLFQSLKNYVQGKEFDLIHTHWVYPAGFVAGKLSIELGIPHIIHAHGSDINILPNKSRRIKDRIVETLESSDRAIFVSNALKNKAIGLGYSGSNSCVIPNGIDSDIFDIRDKVESKCKIGLNPSIPCVGFVGNISHVKRADRFVSIFQKIYSDLEVQFAVVGDGVLFGKVSEECKAKGLPVKFYGRVKADDVPCYMNAMDVMILPSRNEGWPCVVLEAQACGVPVVGSNNGGIPEAIGNGGKVVPDGDGFEKRFAEVVLNQLASPPSISELRERALEFDWSKIVEKEIDVYQTLMIQRTLRDELITKAHA